MKQDPTKIDVPYPNLEVEQKVQGKELYHAPQPVTAPPATPSWQTSSTGSMLTAANTTELTAIYTTLLDIYNALLKEGLIKPK